MVSLVSVCSSAFTVGFKYLPMDWSHPLMTGRINYIVRRWMLAFFQFSKFPRTETCVS